MLTFKGGVHLNEKKELTKNRPIREILSKDILVFPLSQHIGRPAECIVKVGDEVKVGQIIGKAQEGVSASVVSSVSGTVKSIEKRLTVTGNYEDCIVIQNDYKYTTIDDFGKDRDYKQLSRDEIINIIKDAGIVGYGGACFPTHIKLSPKNIDDIDYVLVNGSECEPYLTSDYRLMLEKTDELINGLEIILKLFPKAKGVICIEDNKKDVYNIIKNKLENNYSIDVNLTHTKYPEGAERQLIYAITKRKLNSKYLPSDFSCLVQNVATVIAIYEAVSKSTPLIYKVMTVAGDGFNDNVNLKIRLGNDYNRIIEEVGGFKKDVEKLISGGPMMGNSIYDLNIPVAKNSSALLSFVKDPLRNEKETNCINCGRCVTACPENLVPTMMFNKVKRNDIEGFVKLYGTECIMCGSCSYVCPAKKPLTQYFKSFLPKAKAYINEQSEEKNKK